MSSLALAELESLLRAHKLDSTLTSILPAPQRWDADIVPTGLAPLDALLGGGLPRGHLSEVAGPRSTGRTSVLCALLAATTVRGELVALVDTLDTFDPASGAAARVDLSRLLWIRGSCELTLSTIARGVSERGWGPACIASNSFPGKSDRLACVLKRALKALSLVLHAGGFGVVALDSSGCPGQCDLPGSVYDVAAAISRDRRQQDGLRAAGDGTDRTELGRAHDRAAVCQIGRSVVWRERSGQGVLRLRRPGPARVCEAAERGEELSLVSGQQSSEQCAVRNGQ